MTNYSNEQFPPYDQVQVLIYWNQEPIVGSFNHNKYIYQEIISKLQLSNSIDEIVIIYQDGKLLSQYHQFSLVSKDDQQILHVFRVSDILKFNEQIQENHKLFDQMKQKHNNEINSLQQDIQYFKQTKEALQQYIKDNDNKCDSAIEDRTTISQIEPQQTENLCAITSSQYYIDELQKKKSQEMNYLTQISSKLNDSIFFQSVAVPLKSFCQFCNQDIDQDIIQLSCQHSFHEQCFESLVSAQLLVGEPQFHCLCKTKIKSRELFALSNQQQVQIYQLQMNLNQLKQLKESIQNIRKCDRKHCSFFYIYDQNKNDTQKYCPLCLQ